MISLSNFAPAKNAPTRVCLFLTRSLLAGTQISSFSGYRDALVILSQENLSLYHPRRDWLSKNDQTRVWIFLTTSCYAQFRVSNRSEYRDRLILWEVLLLPRLKSWIQKKKKGKTQTRVCLFLTRSRDAFRTSPTGGVQISLKKYSFYPFKPLASVFSKILSYPASKFYVPAGR